MTCAHAQSFPPAWDGNHSYKQGDLVYWPGTRCTYRATVDQGASVHPDPIHGYSFWELYAVDTVGALSLTVGPSGQFQQLQAAWRYIHNAKIGVGSEIVIKLTQSALVPENFSSSFSLNHPFGAQISIVGDSAAKNRLRFPGNTDGLILSDNHALKRLSGVTIESRASAGIGLAVEDNSNLTADNLSVVNFNAGIFAQKGGHAEFGPGVSIMRFRNALTAISRGFIEFTTPTHIDGGNLGETIGASANEGTITIDGSTIENCDFGVSSMRGGVVNTNGLTMTHIKYWGFTASYGGSIFAVGSLVNKIGYSHKEAVTFKALSNGYILATGSVGDSADSYQTTLPGVQPGTIETRY